MGPEPSFVATAVASAGTIVVVGAGVFIFAVSFAFSSAGVAATSATCALCIVFFVAAVRLTGWLDLRRLGRNLAPIFVAPLIFVAISLAATSTSSVGFDLLVTERRVASGEISRLAGVAAALILFAVLLPAVNAFWDWVSLGISRTYMRLIATTQTRCKGEPETTRPVSQFTEFVVILIDFAIAVVLAGVIVCMTAFFVTLFNDVHIASGGTGFGYDVPATIERIRADPGNSEFWWLYAMMFWTLVPTLVHFIAFSGLLFMQFLKGSIETCSEISAWAQSWWKKDACVAEIDLSTILIGDPARYQGVSLGTAGLGFLLALFRIGPGLFAIYYFYVYAPWLLGFFGQSYASLGEHLMQWALWASNIAANLAAWWGG